MSQTLPIKTLLTSCIIVCYVVLIVATGCSSHQKKRGIVFRGDWAFEVNRTPWVGHPGNTDIPGMEETKSKSGCLKDKESNLSDSLLGPLASLKGKCRCKNCVPAGGNINITSYNPTIANTFPNPVTGAYPGATPPGSLSLPPGAIVVPTGVLMPNGAILPHHLFYPQPGTMGAYGGINPAMGQPIQHLTQQPIQQPAQQQVQPPLQNHQQSPQSSSATQPSQVYEQSGSPSGENTQHGQQNGSGSLPANPTNQTFQQPQLLAPGAANTHHVTQNVVQPDIYGGLAPTLSPEMQAVAAQQAVLQGLNSSNPMLINPAPGQVVAGLSMTGTQAPGYPPIGYAVSGYSPGYAQQVYPPLSGPMAAEQHRQQTLASAGRSQAENASTDTNAETEESASANHVAAMPYPRHHPVPTRPVYQRHMGMAPGYAAVRPPMMSPYMAMQAGPNMFGQTNPGMSPQAQINQSAAMQERQMMLERQRQALIMRQNAAVQQSNARRANGTLAKRTATVAEEEDEEDVIPVAPSSRILLANHQTPILQPSPQRVSQVAHTQEISKKKSR